MSLVSFEFLTFLAVLFLVYFLLPKKVQWVALLTASYAFFVFFDYRFIFFNIGVTLVSFFAAKRLDMFNITARAELAAHKEEWSAEEKKLFKAQAASKRKRWLGFALVLVLGLLALLKYYNFFAENVDALLALLKIEPLLPQIDFLLPLGISFYCFQAAGYLIDVSRGKYAADKNIFRLALFLSFFPQLLQGPISRHDQLAEQLFAPHKFDFVNLRHGFQLMLWGYFKKAVIADKIAVLVGTVFAAEADYAGSLVFVAAAVYGLQIYTDFSGGIDIIRGVAKILGIEMAENFRRPYFSTSVSEFWQRWHITLGSWMKDYVFYPLAISKRTSRFSRWLQKHFGSWIGKMLPTCLISVLVFLLVGIWHGAEWKYVAYGLWNGGIIALSTLMQGLFKKFNSALGINTECFSWRLFRMLRTFLLVTFGRYFVRADNLQHAWQLLRRTFSNFGGSALLDGSLLELGISAKSMVVLAVAVLVLLLVGVLQERGLKLREWIEKQNLWFQWLLELGIIFAILLFGAYGPGYDAADFIYMNF